MGEEKYIICRLCGQVFSDAQAYDEHWTNHVKKVG